MLPLYKPLRKTQKRNFHTHITLIPNNKILNYISSNSSVIMDLIPLKINFCMGLSFLNSSSLLVFCLVTCFLNSTQPGEGCLMGFMAMVKFSGSLDLPLLNPCSSLICHTSIYHTSSHILYKFPL